jgi:outer membrane protein assembly factor BamB
MGRALTIGLAILVACCGSDAAADSTRMRGVDAQHAGAVPDSPLRPPLRIRWQVDTAEPVGEVYVHQGRVFAIHRRMPEDARYLVARSLQTGAELWRRQIRTGEVAADDGHVFYGETVPEAQLARVQGLDPASGAVQWTREFPDAAGLGSGLTPDGGQLFFHTDHYSSSRMHALRQSDGAPLWTAENLGGGTVAPALDGDRVYAALSSGETTAVNRATGTVAWHHGTSSTGGGGWLPVLHGGLLYAGSGTVFDAATGKLAGEWHGGGWLSFAGDVGVHQYEGTARAFGPGWADTRWQNASSTARLVVGDHVYGGSGYYDAKMVHALRLSDGVADWCHLVKAPGSVLTTEAQANSIEAVAAGDGVLMVRAGDSLIAFENGGTGNGGCQTGPGGAQPTPSPSSSEPGAGLRYPPPGAGPGLTIAVSRRLLLLGARTNLTGRLSGVPVDSGTRVVIDLDEFPYDDRWKEAGAGRLDPGGTFAFKYKPRRNARIRARLAGSDVVSAPLEVLADFPFRAQVFGRRSAHPRVRWTIYAFPGAKIRKRRVFAYLSRGKTAPWRRVDARRWQRRRRRWVSVDLRYPAGSLGRRSYWLVCTRERVSDGFGETLEFDRRCGDRVIPHSATPTG